MTRDQYLTEKVLGECWHRLDCCPVKDSSGITYICESCKKEFYFSYDDVAKDKAKLNHNFSSEEGFFKLWNFCKEQDWWTRFVNDAFSRSDYMELIDFIERHLVNPDNLANDLYEFHRKEFPDDHLRVNNK